MGLFTLALAGSGFLVVGALEALSPFTVDPIHPTKPHSYSSPPSFFAISLLSFFFILNSLLSLSDALRSHDRLGSALNLQVLAVAALFLLYSALGLLRDLTTSLPLPPSLLDLIALFAFLEEFLLFYLQRKDPGGIENRYFDLMLFPIAVCVVSTLLGFRSPSSHLPRLSRAVGLILQGTWFLQMGFSFFSEFIVHGCSLTEKSRGNYTIRCKGHPEYHRGRAIATLQFNCHLALMVVMVVGLYAVLVGKNGGGTDLGMYKPVGGVGQFTLDSDDDEIKEEENKQNGGVLQLTAISGI